MEQKADLHSRKEVVRLGHGGLTCEESQCDHVSEVQGRSGGSGGSIAPVEIKLSEYLGVEQKSAATLAVKDVAKRMASNRVSRHAGGRVSPEGDVGKGHDGYARRS